MTGIVTDDITGGKNVNRIARSNGLPVKRFGLNTVARTAVVTTRSIQGAHGQHSGSTISIVPNGAHRYTLAHEVGHFLGLKDSYTEGATTPTGGIMDNPPRRPIPDEVDIIWNAAYDK